VTSGARPAVRDALTYRPVTPEELEACADIWRVSINDYIGRLNQPHLESESGPLVRLYGHLQATDPDRFIVATLPDPEAESGQRIVAFAAAVVRERLWYLSMCFVLPEMQGSGVGRALLARTAPPEAPDTVRATGTDSAQPISNALYASLGIVPKVPLLNLIGLPSRPEAFGAMPAGIRAVPFERLAGDGHDRLVGIVDALDRATLGVSHPVDHRYLRAEGRRGWLYQGPDGSPVAYGYATEAGRVGPVAAGDPELLAPILGHLTSEVIPRGAFAVWLPGTADRAVVGALQAGFRLEPFPVLLCWDRPMIDLSRYLPISPGLL
jgi:GNAT superfamily N-acetyltransferase